MAVALYNMLWKYRVAKFKLSNFYLTFNPPTFPHPPPLWFIQCLSTLLQKNRITNYGSFGVGLYTSINLSLSVWLTEYLDCGYGSFSCGTGMSHPLLGRASLPGASPCRRCLGQSGVSSQPPGHGMRSRWTPPDDPGSTWLSWKHYPAAPEKEMQIATDER